MYQTKQENLRDVKALAAVIQAALKGRKVSEGRLHRAMSAIRGLAAAAGCDHHEITKAMS